MLIGEYTHTQDEKKRISLPIKFRKELGKKVYITRGLDGCLFLYSSKDWMDMVKQVNKLSWAHADSRQFNRQFLGSAVEAEPDAIGRILIPEHLRESAQLDGKVVFAGLYTRVEIWNETSWIKQKKNLSAKADELAQKLGEIGAL